jgi:4-amino-4-deoxy-L-arabinose transferase-like glycosyltransferase
VKIDWVNTPARTRTVGEWLSLTVLLGLTAVLYLWNLAVSGWANGFYSAAAQAGADNWTAMLFGSSDAANAITVDKTPAALWVTDISVRLFGLSSWSILVPQALEGVAGVALLYAAVRRAAGPGAALLAGVVFAATPAATLMFRFNNPDALLVLLLVAGAYCVQRACEPDAGRRWLVLAGVAVGFAFLAKMLQAFLVLPAFAAAYLVAAQGRLRTRVLRLLAATVAMVVAGGWYLLLAELWPAGSRPYIGGSQHNSIIELALGYNGVGRLTGDEPGGLGNMNFDVGWGRLLGSEMGTYAGWLLPTALICLVAGFIIIGRAPRTDPARAALILWGGWLLVTAAVFSYANGIVHAYYTVALAPALGAVIGIGATLLWRRRSELTTRVALAGTVAVTVVLAAVLLARDTDGLNWLRAAIAVAGVGSAAALLALPRLALHRTIAALAAGSCLAAPTVYAVQTATVAHTGAMPSVGPSRGGLPGGFGGGLLDSPTPGPGLTDVLRTDAGKYRWTAAAIGSNNAAGYQLAAGAPVLAVGGFNGTDPAPTLAQFQHYVADQQIHYFVRGAMMMHHGSGGGSNNAQEIATWVRSHFSPTTVENTVVYDLTTPVSA